MLIKDIRYPKLKALAKKYTRYQRPYIPDKDIPNKELLISFAWYETQQNSLFWDLVDGGNYKEARKIFDWDSDTIKEDIEDLEDLEDLEDYKETPREFDVSPIINHSDNTNDSLLIDKPEHYSKGIDTFQRMEANCTKEECLTFAKGNIDKYNWRTKGQDLEDFKKIIAYAQWAIKLLS